jgi:tetratricopeptide (TPR) repeat protein
MDDAVSQRSAELVAQGQYDAALDLLSRERERDPDDWTVHRQIGVAHRAKGDHAQAIESFSSAALALIRLSSPERAAHLQEDLDLVPTSYGAFIPMLKPVCYDHCRASLSGGLDYATLRNDTGFCLLELGDVPNARRMLCEAVEFIPAGSGYDDPWIWLLRIEDL